MSPLFTGNTTLGTSQAYANTNPNSRKLTPRSHLHTGSCDRARRFYSKRSSLYEVSVLQATKIFRTGRVLSGSSKDQRAVLLFQKNLLL